MPRLFLPFTDWQPDAGALRNPGLLECFGVVPFHDVYVPLSPMINVGAGASGLLSGSHVHMQEGDNSAGWAVYGGASDALWWWDPDTSPWTADDVSKTSDASYTGVGSEGWFFESFGDYVIAVGGHSITPQYRTASGGRFADLFAGGTDYSPKPKFIATLGGRVAMANCANVGGASTFDPDPNLVFVSKTDNAREFSDPATSPGDRTDFFLIYDGLGPITGMVGGQEYGVLFKERAVYRIDFKGAYSLDFPVVSHSLGCRHPQSAVWVGNSLYFMSNQGPAVLEYDAVRTLGDQKIQRALVDNTFISFSYDPAMSSVASERWSGAYDPGTQTIVWCYSSAEGSRALFYSVASGRFSLSKPMVPLNGIPPYRVIQLPERGRDFGAPRDTAWAYGNADLPSVHGWAIGDIESGTFFDADILFRTGFTSLSEEGATRVTGVRPVFNLNGGETTYPTITAKVYTRNVPWGEDEQTASDDTDTAGQPDSRGFITLPGATWGELHSVELTIDAGSGGASPASQIAEIEGVEIEYQVEGGKPARRAS